MGRLSTGISEIISRSPKCAIPCPVGGKRSPSARSEKPTAVSPAVLAKGAVWARARPEIPPEAPHVSPRQPVPPPGRAPPPRSAHRLAGRVLVPGAATGREKETQQRKTNQKRAGACEPRSPVPRGRPCRAWRRREKEARCVTPDASGGDSTAARAPRRRRRIWALPAQPSRRLKRPQLGTRPRPGKTVPGPHARPRPAWSWGAPDRGDPDAPAPAPFPPPPAPRRCPRGAVKPQVSAASTSPSPSVAPPARGGGPEAPDFPRESPLRWWRRPSGEFPATGTFAAGSECGCDRSGGRPCTCGDSGAASGRLVTLRVTPRLSSTLPELNWTHPSQVGLRPAGFIHSFHTKWVFKCEDTTVVRTPWRPCPQGPGIPVGKAKQSAF